MAELVPFPKYIPPHALLAALNGRDAMETLKDGSYGPIGFGKDVVARADPGGSRHVHQRDQIQL